MIIENIITCASFQGNFGVPGPQGIPGSRGARVSSSCNSCELFLLVFFRYILYL